MKISEVKNPQFFGRGARIYDPAFLIGGALICVALFGYFSMALDLPVRTTEDHIFMLVQIKKIVNGSGWRWEPHLGFPGVQDQMLFPLLDFSYRLINEILAKFTSNIFLIANLTYIIGISLVFGFTYYALRLLEVRPWIAFVGGVGFTMSTFLSQRSYSHDYLALYFSVPLGGILCLLLARSNAVSVGARLRDKTAILALLVVSTSGLYYAFFTCMFLLMTALAKSVAERRFSPVVFALLFSANLLLLLLIFGYGTALLELAQGQLPTVSREPFEQVLYALFLGTGLHVFADAGLGSASFAHYDQVITSIIGRPLLEWPGMMITSVILLSPILAFVLGALPKQQGRPAPRLDTIMLCAMLISFGIVFAASGGLGFVFNFVVSPVIRAQARILPFLSFFAIVIIVIAMQHLSELRNAFMRHAVSAITAAVLIASVAPVVGSSWAKQAAYLSSPEYASTHRISAMIKEKDSAGLQAILQLPYAGWPELADVGNFKLYNHQIPYLLDTSGSTTKWSYGLTPTQPAFKEVSETLDLANAPTDLAERAARLGFDGILIEKTAYSADELGRIEGIIAESPTSCRLFDDAERVLFSLKNNEGCVRN